MERMTFTMNKIMTISTTVWFVAAGFVILAGYFGIKIYLGDVQKYFGVNSMGALMAASGVIWAGMYFIKQHGQKEEVKIEVIDRQDIIITYDGVEKISGKISDIVKISTIHKRERRADVQAEIVFKQGKVNLYSTLNDRNKRAYDDFMTYLEDEFKFTYRKAPMSLRWSKNYVEYTNPLYHE